MDERRYEERQKIRGGEMLYADAAGELTLPDYKPEMRRILEVRSAVIPAGSYVSGDRTEFAGNVQHSVLYTDGEGQVAAAQLTLPYECSMAAVLREGDICARSGLDSVICRPTGPRRLNLRSVVNTWAVGYENEPVTPGILPLLADEQAERLMSERLSRRAVPFSSGELSVRDTARADTQEPVEVLLCEARVLPGECRAAQGCVVCRGDLWIKALLTGPHAEGTPAPIPYAVERRVPFEQSVPAEGVHGEDRVRVFGFCRNVQATVAEEAGGGDVLFDVTYELFGEAVRNESLSVVSDVYGTAYAMQAQTEPLDTVVSLWCSSFCGSADGEGERDEGGMLESISDVSASVVESHAETEGRTLRVQGKARVNLLGSVSSGEEGIPAPAARSMVLPFCLETQMDAEAPADARIDAVPVVVRVAAGMDAAQIHVTADLSVQAEVTAPLTGRVVCGATADREQTCQRTGAHLVVVYPDEQDTLWSIAKQFGVPLDTVVSCNELPEEMRTDPGRPGSLDGYNKLLIEL